MKRQISVAVLTVLALAQVSSAVQSLGHRSRYNVSNDLSVTGDLTVAGDLSVAGDTSLVGDLTVAGDIWLADDSKTGQATNYWAYDETNTVIWASVGTSVGLQIASPSTEFHVAGTTPTITIGDGDEEDTLIVFDGNDNDWHFGPDDTDDAFKWGAGSALGTTDYVVLTDLGLLAIGMGATLPSDMLHIGSNTDGDIALQTAAASEVSAINFRRSKGTLASPTIAVTAGDDIGLLDFYTYTAVANAFNNQNFASILVEVDAAAANNDCPGRIVWKTTLDGENTPAEHMRLGNAGVWTLTQNSDTLAVTLDGSDVYFKQSDGDIYFQPDEGTNTDSILIVKSKGTGNAIIRALDEDSSGFTSLEHTGSAAYLYTNVGSIQIQHAAEVPVAVFSTAVSGRTPEFTIGGYRSGDALRQLEFGVGVDAADTASFDGVSNYLFDGTVKSTKLLAGRTTAIGSQAIESDDIEVVDEADLGTESLGEPDFATHAKWDDVGDMLSTSGAAVYTHSGGTGTLTQTAANLDLTGENNRKYAFTYTVSGATGDADATITTAFGLTAIALDISDGTNTTYFQADTAASSADFVISGTSSSGGFTLDDITLKEMVGGDLIVAGWITGGGTDLGMQIDGDGAITFTPITVELDFPLVNVAAGGSGLTATAVGNYVGEAFGIGDIAYIEVDVPADWDRTSNFGIDIHYAHDTAGESAEEMQFQVEWSSAPHDGTETILAPTHTGTIDGGDFSPHATQYQYDEKLLGTISAASVAAGDTIGLKLSRIAIDGGDEVEGEPIVFHVGVIYDIDNLAK